MEQIIVDTGSSNAEKPKFDWYNLIAAIVMIIIGLTLLIWPGESNLVIVYVVASLVALAGLVLVILYFVRKESIVPFVFGGLSVGLTLLFIGILLLLIPNILITILPIALGFFLIFSGFNTLQTAVALARMKVVRWFLPLIFAVISIICGVLALFNPFSMANVLMIFLGVSLLAEGLMLLVSLFLFRKDFQA